MFTKTGGLLHAMKFYLQSRKIPKTKHNRCVEKRSSYRPLANSPCEHQKPPWYNHFISKPTNQGSVEICGKAVNRGGVLVWKYNVFFMV